MKTVHKFYLIGNPGYWDFHLGGEQPSVVHVGLDPKRELCVWVEIDTDAPGRTHRIVMHGTGHAVQAGCNHIGSVVHPPYVWHFYSPTLRKAP